ncbi:MAG: DUF2911 domain-containing protein [Gemmatimonadota bacterium]|nr:DUF2911 domain-containing protein [Gemmatimonadota bacterium]
MRYGRTSIGALGLLAGALTLGGTAEAAAQERASPLDYARNTIGGHEIEIQYGRPSMRGRAIYGGLVPWDRVWRTGANEATHLRTPVDLMIGDTPVPAGEYTLFTIPSEDGWTLIVNSQTGQWGTAYDEEQDFARIPIASDSLEDPVETLTITIEEGDDTDGVIHIDWEGTRAIVPFDIASGG